MKVKTLIPKSEARKMVLERRKDFSDAEIKRKTERIIEKLSRMDQFVLAETVHCYISSRPGEVDTHKLISLMEGMGKAIVVPKLNPVTKLFLRGNFSGWNNLIENDEGYLEPAVGINDDLNDVDLYIIPSVALTVYGQRVGYGGGYYDKLLKNTFAPQIALAFEFQLFDNIEASRGDLILDKIVTELRVIDTHGGKY